MELGGKANSLIRLESLGLHVPEWVILHPHESARELAAKVTKKWGEAGKDKVFAVRSSAKGEDGAELSFAGLFHTELSVVYNNLWPAVEKCRRALDSQGLRNYLAHHQKTFHSSDLHLIIQEMVPADCAGVLFTVHPSGYADRRLVEVARGLGDQVVEAKVAVERWLFNKTTQDWLLEATPSETILTPKMLQELQQMSLKLEESDDFFYDVEFAFTGPKLHVLQARPITTLRHKKLMLLDGANIQENYPRMSTPLTLSGLQRGYEINFRSLLKKMGVEAHTIEELSEPLKNMTYVLNGHVYYRIENWSAIIARTPFFSKSALSSFQLMTGALTQSQSLRKKPSWRQSLTIFFNLARTLILRSHFERQYEEAMARFYQEAKNLPGKNQEERVKEILAWSERVYASYWFPLLNDLFCGLFLYFCTKILEKKNLSTTLLNDYIGSIEDMESAKCVSHLKQLALSLSLPEIDSIQRGHPKLTQETQRAVSAYLERFGDRSVEEMKIETPSKRENIPAFLGELVQLKKALENAPQIEKVLFHFELGVIFSWCLKQYTQALRFRENSRFHRVRVKGLLREEILRLSEKLELDLFYLHADELTLSTEKWQGLIEARQKTWFKNIPMPQRLLWFEGVDYEALSASKTPPSPNQGLGCAGGIVEAEVLVIDRPDTGVNVEGKILVAETTDPGWIYLMLQAKGLIIERGNMLSHTAIIGRELGIPTIISFPQAKQKLAGKRIRMNGQTGKVDIIDP
jgi:phosphohistidine swiveling domain-containing protein